MKSVRSFSLRSNPQRWWVWGALPLVAVVCFFIVDFSGGGDSRTERKGEPDIGGGRPVAEGRDRPAKPPSAGPSSEGRSMEELRREWDELKNTDLTEKEKRGKFAQLIEAMVTAGHYEEAKTLALEPDEGLLRQALVHSLFSKTTDLKTALSRMNEGGFDGPDMNWVRSGIMLSLSDRDGSRRALDYLKAGDKLSDTETKMLICGVSSYLDPEMTTAQFYNDESRGIRSPDREEMLRRLGMIRNNADELVAARPDLKGKMMLNLALCTSFRMPEESVSIIEKSHGDMVPGDLQPVVDETIASLFYNSPAKGIEAVARLQGKVDCSSAINLGMQRWLGSDSKSALAWLNKENGAANPAVFDTASSAAAGYLIRKGRTEDAAELVARMVAPEAREAGQEMIRNNEAERYLKGAQADLSGHLDSLVAPQSAEPAFYIEKTLGHWIENDPSKAQAWYEKNWSSLSGEKAQFVAAAYAADAARLHDPEAAAHWLGFITDETVRKRIQDQIITRGKR